MVVIPIFFLCEFCLGYVWCVCVCALLLILIYRYKQNVLIFCWFIISTTKNLSYQQSWWLQRLITTKIISIDLWWTKKKNKKKFNAQEMNLMNFTWKHENDVISFITKTKIFQIHSIHSMFFSTYLESSIIKCLSSSINFFFNW